MDEFYEVDLLDDLPIPQPQAPMVRVGSMSDATSVASTTFSYGGSSGALRRAGTPIPNSTLRESQRERLRELIDYDRTATKKGGSTRMGEKPKKHMGFLRRTKSLAASFAKGLRHRELGHR